MLRQCYWLAFRMPTMLDPGTLKRSFSRLNSPHFTLKIITTPSSQNQNSVMQLKHFFFPKRFEFFQINLCCLNKQNATSAALLRLHQNLFDNALLHCRSRAWVCVCACETVPAHLFLPLLPVEVNEAQSCSLKVKANTRIQRKRWHGSPEFSGMKGAAADWLSWINEQTETERGGVWTSYLD